MEKSTACEQEHDQERQYSISMAIFLLIISIICFLLFLGTLRSAT